MTGRSKPDHFIVSDSDLALFCDRNTCEGSDRCIDCNRSDGAYDDSGDLEYCGCDEQYSQYRDHAPLYQLWGNFGGISAVGNGACVKCV